MVTCEAVLFRADSFARRARTELAPLPRCFAATLSHGAKINAVAGTSPATALVEVSGVFKLIGIAAKTRHRPK